MSWETIGNEKFIHYLQRELVRRISDNPRYSLRSFANACNTSPGALSAILSKKRKLTEKTKTRIIDSLGLTLKDFTWLQDTKEILPLDQMAVASEWYHFAILELIKTVDFKPNTKWIAQRFDLNIKEVEVAAERLIRLGLLKVSEDKWVDTFSDKYLNNFDGELSTPAHREMQKRLLEKSIFSLENTEVQMRNHTGVTMAINKKDIAKAKKLIEEFEMKFMEIMEENPKPEEVYHLAVNFFPLSNLNKKK